MGRGAHGGEYIGEAMFDERTRFEDGKRWVWPTRHPK